ncbi:MAG: tryptophan--tRNA ligase [Candidatus Berkelbacteria bacterium]
MTKRIFSGIQPSGIIHLGNYLGAIKQWVDTQDTADQAIFCVVDLHAITVPQDPKALQQNILNAAALYIACGVNPEKAVIYVQSSVPQHSELMWILNTIATMGELSRMTQFKEKSAKNTNSDSVGVGLFDYPVLMAADILLYGTTHVPVGHDQKQHVELARDLAQRFNSRFGETFVVPEPIIKKESARIMGLDDPTKKMSKSASSPLNYIAMTDDAETIRNKFKRAVTDSGSEIVAREDKPAITNLLNILSEVSGKSVAELEKNFAGIGYGDFKMAVAEAVIEYLKPIQDKYFELLKDESKLKAILREGAERIAPIAKKTLKEVQEKVGLGI